MVKDHSDSERGNPLPPHGLLLPININAYKKSVAAKGSPCGDSRIPLSLSGPLPYV